MSRITLTYATEIGGHDWIRARQEQIQSHPAWYKGMNEKNAEALLHEKLPFTFLLRHGEKEHSYFISFVKEDNSIKHQYFTLEFDRRGWYYKNGVITPGLPEVVTDNLDELIPLMMHCTPDQGKILEKP